MKLRLMLVSVATCFTLALGSGVSQAFPGLPSLPSLPGVGGQPEPWFATNLNDAVTDVPFLDGYDPSYRIPVQEMPQGPKGEFLLGPGAYDLWAESYCLTPGAHRPGAGHGEGYAYAPSRGKGATVIENLLRRSVLHPEVPQHDIQVLIWALIAQTPYDQLDAKLRQTAEVLLDKTDLDSLAKAAQERLTAEMLSQLANYLPGPVQQILDAEASLRGLLNGALPGYAEIEAIAVAAGDPGTHDGDREIVTGRWSYHPDGCFVSFFPEGYQGTLAEVVNPSTTTVSTDKLGRVTRVADSQGNSIEVVYAAQTYTIPGSPDRVACPLESLRVTQCLPWRSQSPVVVQLSKVGYVLQETSQGAASSGAAAPATLPARLAAATSHRQQFERLTTSICKINKRPPECSERTAALASLTRLGAFAQGVRDSLAEASARDPRADVSMANPAFEAWQAAVVNFGQSLQKQGSAGKSGSGLLAASGHFSGGWKRGAGEGRLGMSQVSDQFRAGGAGAAPSWLKPFDPSDGVSQPGNQGRQRLGVSGRGKNDGGRPAGQRNQHRDGDKDAWKNKDILVKARECMGWIEGISDAGSALDNLGQFGISKGESAMKLDFQGAVKDAMFDFMFESAGQISQGLGGDPPRPDFTDITMPAKIKVQTLCAGMQQLPKEDGLLGTVAELQAVLEAAQIARDRLGGAVTVSNTPGIQRQAAVLIELKRRSGLLWVRLADRLDEAATQLEKKPPAAQPASNYRERLAHQGFGKAELEAARRLGLSAERLEAIKQRRLKPAEREAAPALPEALHEVAASYRELGQMWSCLPGTEK